MLCYGGYKLAYPTYSWNQKLTVTISTPNGDKSGSAVVSAKVVYSPRLMEHIGGSRYSHIGEATAVDLGEGRYVFVLLGKPIVSVLRAYKHLVPPDYKYGKSRPPRYDLSSLFQRFGLIPEAVQITPELYLSEWVTFENINDPVSVKLVDPNDLAATFGEGYSFKEMTLEITNEKVTEDKINLLLAWLSEYSESHYRLNGARCISCPIQMEPLEDYLAPAYFKLGEL